MVRTASLRALPALLWLALAGHAHAGQPLFTDDAAVVTPHTCQLEAWTTTTAGSQQYLLQPACNLFANLELDLGIARVRAGTQDAVLASVQVKRVLATIGDGTWSLGAEAGAFRDSSATAGPSAFQQVGARALVSWYPTTELEVDMNVGLARAYGAGAFGVAGVAMQYEAVPTLQALAELYRDQPGRPAYAAGLRWAVVPGSFETYVSWSNRMGERAAHGVITLGVRLQSAALAD